MVLKTISIRVDEDQLKWLDEKTEKLDFASRAHGIRYCIQHVMDESNPLEHLEKVSQVAKGLGMASEEGVEKKNE